MQKTLCKHYIISGHVQGVWFRASTRDQAELHGVTGWVKNCPDGSVEVMARGTEEQLQKLHEWLLRGPKNARVDHLVCEEVIDYEFLYFEIK